MYEKVINFYQKNIKKTVWSVFLFSFLVCLTLNIFFTPYSKQFFLFSIKDIVFVVLFRYLCLGVCAFKYYISTILLSNLFIMLEVINLIFIHYQNFTLFYILNLLIPLIILWIVVLKFIKQTKNPI